MIIRCPHSISRSSSSGSTPSTLPATRPWRPTVSGARLEAAGFEIARHEHAPGRTNLIARLPGTDPGRPALCMTGHLDTVPLGGAPWSGRAVRRAARRPAVRPRRERHEGRRGGDRRRRRAGRRARPRRRRGSSWCLRRRGDRLRGRARTSAGAGALGRAGAVLVAEPTGGVPHVAHKGVLFARATHRGRRRARLRRRTSAATRSTRSPRAVAALADLTFDVPTHPLLGDPTLNVGTIAAASSINVVPGPRRGADRRPYGARPDRRRRARPRSEAAAGPDVDARAADRPRRRSSPTPTTPGSARSFEVSPPSRAGWPTSPTPPRSRRPTATRRPSSGAPARPPRRTRPTNGPRPPRSTRRRTTFFEVARRWCGV